MPPRAPWIVVLAYARPDVTTPNATINYSIKGQPRPSAIVALHVLALTAIKEGFNGVLLERTTCIATGSDSPHPLLGCFEDHGAPIEDRCWRIRDGWRAYMITDGQRVHEVSGPDDRFDAIVELLTASQPTWQPGEAMHHKFLADDGTTSVSLSISVTESYPIAVNVEILDGVSHSRAASTIRAIYGQ